VILRTSFQGFDLVAECNYEHRLRSLCNKEGTDVKVWSLYPGWAHGFFMIYLLTAIGLTPGGSSTAHIYTQTIHRTTQITTEQHK